MYCCSDPRVEGLVLANPWVRTDAGQARTQVRHYYGRRVLTRFFWRKLVSGRLDMRDSLRSLTATLRRSCGGASAISSSGPSNYIDRMQAGLAGFVRMRRPILLLMSGRDLTAREFDDLCHSSPAWAEPMVAAGVRRFDLPDADHTFSASGTLEAATTALLDWLPQCAAKIKN
jgi:hypothetical protein